MKTSITALLSTIALALALPGPTSSGGIKAFGITALRSASPIHFGQLNAAKRNIFINLPHQNSTCAGEDSGFATFFIEKGSMYLYRSPGEKQQIFVDRSGMGQGKLGYISSKEKGPKNGELKGWVIDEFDNLSFKDESLIACPGSIDDSYSVWVNTNREHPGGNKGCLMFEARTLPAEKPVSCKYTTD